MYSTVQSPSDAVKVKTLQELTTSAQDGHSSCQDLKSVAARFIWLQLV